MDKIVKDLNQVVNFVTVISEKMVGKKYHAVIKNKTMPYTHIGVVRYNGGWEQLSFNVFTNGESINTTEKWSKLLEHLEVVAVIELENLEYLDYQLPPTYFDYTKN